MRNAIVILILMSLGLSCSSAKNLPHNKDQYGITVDKSWQQEIKRSQNIVKKTVNDYQQVLLAKMGEEDLPLFFKKDMNSLDVFPIEVYYIDSITIRSINQQNDFISKLTPTNEATYFFFEKGEYVTNEIIAFKNGKWEREYGGGKLIIGNYFIPKLKEVLWEKPRRFFTVKVQRYSKYFVYFHTYIDENGDLMYFNESGAHGSLLEKIKSYTMK